MENNENTSTSQTHKNMPLQGLKTLFFFMAISHNSMKKIHREGKQV
jgi:hypothetical protein